jgi:hypothetical protein
MKNLLKDIFENANRILTYDNRNYYVKNLNLLLERNEISIKIQIDGKVWLKDINLGPSDYLSDKSLNKYNIVISAYGWNRKFYISNYITPKEILTQVANLLTNENVKNNRLQKLNVNLKEYKECQKCNGKKIIPAFKHVCSGICFECGGSGIGYHQNKFVNI